MGTDPLVDLTVERQKMINYWLRSEDLNLDTPIKTLIRRAYIISSLYGTEAVIYEWRPDVPA